MKKSFPAIVLMYHRIDDTQTNPWNICVSPERFKEQVSFLKNNFNVIGINELISQIKESDVQENSLCITFDDGYEDNFIHAKPVLEKFNCPATFFISTALIGHKTFWWDELENIFLYTKKLPGYLHFSIAKKPHEYFIKETILTAEQFVMHKQWKWYDEKPTTRCEAFALIWQALQPLYLTEIEEAINSIKLWAEIKEGNSLNRFTMHEEQLKLLQQNELFSIGLHTHTHTNLKEKNKDFQHDEIAICKNNLQDNFNIETNILAYPYGLFDQNSISVAKALNLDACFTTESGIINNSSNLYALNRLQICDWDDEYFHKYMQDISAKYSFNS